MAAGLIPPDVRHRLRGLRLHAPRALGGRGMGLQRSLERGSGLEFSRYRGYEQGDELRHVDWKLFARSDRFFVREAQRESPLTAWIVLDASASMAQDNGDGSRLKRVDAARGIAACIADIAVAHGDAVGLLACSHDRFEFSPAAIGPRARDRLLLALGAVGPSGAASPPARLARIGQQTRAGELIVFLSDGFDDGLVDAALQCAAAGRAVAFIQLLTRQEREFPFRDGHVFRDVETGRELVGDGPAMRATYVQAMERAIHALAARLANAGAAHELHVIDAPMDQPLQRLFGRGAA